MGKKSANILGLLIIGAGLAAFAIIGFNVYLDSKDAGRYFNPAKKVAAEKLYNSIISRDLDGDYPKSPEQVMEFNMDIALLVYGDMVTDYSLFEGVISQQRRLFSDALLEVSDINTQLESLYETLGIMKEEGISCYRFNNLPGIYNPFNTELCYIRVEQLFSTGEILYWSYNLEKNAETGKWEITRWEATDQYYAPLAAEQAAP